MDSQKKFTIDALGKSNHRDGHQEKKFQSHFHSLTEQKSARFGF